MSGRLLPATLTWHDVKDVESFTRRILDRRIKTSRWKPKTSEDYNDFLADMLTIATQAKQRWENPNLPKPTRSFSDLLYRRLNYGYDDTLRQTYWGGRTRWQFATHTVTRTIPTIIPYHFTDDGPPTGSPRLPREVARALGQGEMDSQEHRHETSAWLEDLRDSQTPPPHHLPSREHET